MNRSAPLAGRVVLLTGLSRSIGIGYAIAKRLLDDGASVFATGWDAHDAEMPWGVDPFDESGFPPDRFFYQQADLADPDVPTELVDATIDRYGRIDAVVANHARSSTDSLSDVTVDELDKCWNINARGSLLLAREFGRRFKPSAHGGRVVFFTSGQHQGPMDNEIAYSLSKGAIHQMTLSVSNHYADAGITVNCINPGPVDTGYAHGAWHEAVRAGFPAGRWGEPDDVANLAAWLLTDDAKWITGQVINSTGGWRGPKH